MTVSKPTLSNIHALRAVAAMMVVFWHASEQFDAGFMLFATDFGNAGVDIFFVISGFVMVYTSTLRPKGAGAFIRDRLLRIVPMYWIFTTLTVGFILIAPSAFRGSVFDPIHTVMSYLFLAYPHPVNEGSFSPILRVGWTLNYEMFFYVTFAAAMFINYSMRVQVSLTVLALCVLMGPFWGDTTFALFYCRPIILEFGMGMLIAVAFLKGWLSKIPVRGGQALLALGSVTIFLSGPLVGSDSALRFLFFGLSAATLVVGALALERSSSMPFNRVTNLLGAASYVIYLSHPFVLAAVRILLVKIGIDGASLLSNTVGILIMLLIVMIVGTFSHLWLEKPVTRMLDQNKKNKVVLDG